MQKDTPNEQYLKLNKELAYETIVTPKGKPHATAIILLADIINQYKLKLIPTENSQKATDLCFLFLELIKAKLSARI